VQLSGGTEKSNAVRFDQLQFSARARRSRFPSRFLAVPFPRVSRVSGKAVRAKRSRYNEYANRPAFGYIRFGGETAASRLEGDLRPPPPPPRVIKVPRLVRHGERGKVAFPRARFPFHRSLAIVSHARRRAATSPLRDASIAKLYSTATRPRYVNGSSVQVPSTWEAAAQSRNFPANLVRMHPTSFTSRPRRESRGDYDDWRPDEGFVASRRAKLTGRRRRATTRR